MFWFAFLADFDDEAAVLYSARDAGVRDEKLHHRCTWFFRAKARLSPAKTWKDVLHSRENLQKICLDVIALLQTFACFDIARQDLGTVLMENHVFADETFVWVAFHEIQWQGRLRHGTLIKSTIPISWVWSIFTENQKLNIWSSMTFCAGVSWLHFFATWRGRAKSLYKPYSYPKYMKISKIHVSLRITPTTANDSITFLFAICC